MADQPPLTPHRRSRARAKARQESATAHSPDGSRLEHATAGAASSVASGPSTSPASDAGADNKARPDTTDPPAEAEALIVELEAVHADLVELERRRSAQIAGIQKSNQASARNLLHYLALRRHDIRPLQEKLARLGLSSLGRAESHVKATVEAVLIVLHQLAHRPWRPAAGPDASLGFDEGIDRLEANAAGLLGPEPAGRSVRIMVTMPSDAAEDYVLVRDLLDRGMNCMRINCAHDDASAWGRMVAHLRRAEHDVGKPCRILMDLAGPKLRTGPIGPGPRVLKWRPRRDALGRVIAPARIWLVPQGHVLPPPAESDGCLPVQGRALARLEVGDRLAFTDARGSRRTLEIVAAVGEGRWAETDRTAYVTPGTRLRVEYGKANRRHGKVAGRLVVGELPPCEQTLLLGEGDSLILTRDLIPGKPAVHDALGRLLTPATIGCTLPEVFACVRPHERIWLDDGKLGGVITSVCEDQIHVEVTDAKAGGARLGADKGINLPDSNLVLPALTAKDLDDLVFVASNADLVGYSFVREPAGIAELRSHLERLGGTGVGLVLKIETRRAFQGLPDLLLEAMRWPGAGAMIARGDLAIECGYERLAEVQEEILWISEAAHVPVIWATQVLESLAKGGQPSRAEITDAAMGQRAECVMLNKGPHILEAVEALDDILGRMQAHQTKKRSLLRPLRLADIVD